MGGANRFGRGINIPEYLAYPASETWPLFTGRSADVSVDELRRLAAAGFSFVRLPVEPAPFLIEDGVRRGELERRLSQFVERANAAGLAVLVTGFPRYETPSWSTTEILDSPTGPKFNAYAQFLSRLAEIAGTAPDGMAALELMNEPQQACRETERPDWTAFQKTLFDRLLKDAPRLLLMVTGGCWSGRAGLRFLDMKPFDERTLVAVHYYEPFTFTHQAADWTEIELEYLAGLSFPARLTDRKRVAAVMARLFERRHARPRYDKRPLPQTLEPSRRVLEAYLNDSPNERTVAGHLAAIADWAARRALPPERIVITEFGAYRSPTEAEVADDGSRDRWIGAVRKSAEANRMGWALWSYRAGFGLMADEETGRLDPGTLRALGLREPE